MVTDSIGERNQALLDWYRSHGRDLPWRATTDPYRILVSEVMLQQTQVTRVVPIYERFLARFPTVEALAASPLADVIEAWRGLGYNTRARRLRDAARAIVSTGWPTDSAGLKRLPGVGPYTAAAVASFAFGERVAAVDTNLRRVLSRWLGAPLSGERLADATTDELPEGAAPWNQAVMDLGATLCRPRRPRCDECPVEPWCADPTVYEPPPKQPPFAGSDREVRGAVLAAVRSTAWQDGGAIAAAADHPVTRVEMAIAALAKDGLVDVGPKGVRLAR